MFVCVVLLTCAFPALAGRVGGSDGNVAGNVEFGGNRTAFLPLFRPTTISSPGGNNSRFEREQRFLREIHDYILNVTGRKNWTHPAGQTKDTSGEKEDSPSPMDLDYNVDDLVQSTVPPDETERIQRTSSKNTRNQRAMAITFTADEVLKDNNSDVLIQFALHNYTEIQVETAELIVLLRYRHRPVNQSASSRRPEVRRITISVYRDFGNARSSGNASSVDRSSMTTSLFQIRRTKWVKVLLMRGWIQDAISSPSRTLRLRLVYDNSGSIEVVTTSGRRSGRAQGKTNRKRLREGATRASSPPPKELTGKRKQKLSPVLLVMKRDRLPT